MQLNLIILFLASIIGCSVSQTGRVINGHEVDTKSRFPHHVTIRCKLSTANNSNIVRNCSGSIIHNRWILTSASCANTSFDLEIQFQRLYFSSSWGSFSVVVGPNAVSVYPTNSAIDDLALINLPITLPTNSDLKPILLSKDEYLSTIGQMPGFSQDRLTYGLFEASYNCGSYYGVSNYDQYYQFCVRGYANGFYAAAEGNEGAGLIVGAPRQPQLIGVLSKVNSGSKSSPSIVIKVQKYFQWIQYITGNQVRVF